MAFSDVLLAFDESIRASDTFVNSTIDNRTRGSCPSFSLEKPSLMRYSWGRRPVLSRVGFLGVQGAKPPYRGLGCPQCFSFFLSPPPAARKTGKRCFAGTPQYCSIKKNGPT